MNHIWVDYFLLVFFLPKCITFIYPDKTIEIKISFTKVTWPRRQLHTLWKNIEKWKLTPSDWMLFFLFCFLQVYVYNTNTCLEGSRTFVTFFLIQQTTGVNLGLWPNNQKQTSRWWPESLMSSSGLFFTEYVWQRRKGLERTWKTLCCIVWWLVSDGLGKHFHEWTHRPLQARQSHPDSH